MGVEGQRLFNPGSSAWKRQAPTHTIGLLGVGGGVILRHEIIDV